jgi:acyl dehydratase
VKIVDLIREKTQKMSFESFSAEALELQVRELRTSLTERLALVRTSEIWTRLGAAPTPDANPAVRAYHESLLKKLGCVVHLGEWHEITQDAIDTFAGVTKDKQWIHVDKVRARRESPFRSTVAQGFLIVAMIPALREYESLVASADFPVRMVVNCGIDKVRFLSPVKPGSRIRARTLLKKIGLNRKFIEVTEEVTIEIAVGAKSVCVADIVYRVYL